MLKPLSTLLIVVTMLFSLVGQAYSYTVSACDKHQHTMPSMDHSEMMSSSMMDNENTSMADCCDIECECPANACSSFSYLSIEQSSIKLDSAIDKISYTSHSILQFQRNSLYRPPIIS